ncbi:MAG: M23 family metallopeptidase [Bacteroidota bacterium]|nr:M23 family metallopeptidase [Bacteroidota bacterium]
MRLIGFFFIIIVLSSCGVQHHFVSSKEAKDDTSYVYALPYPKGASRLMVQGYKSQFSHRGRLSLDFKMKRGSLITAARDGVVARVEQSFSGGGVHKKYLRKANQVVIKHSDGSQAYYGHVQQNGVLVNLGDTVRVGQVIAKSGNTGYSAFPHLHFIVWGPTPSGRRSQLPTRFLTKKGIRYLRPGRWYRAL